jgi:hypothetical protein
VEFQPGEVIFEAETPTATSRDLIVGLVNAFQDTGACCCISPPPDGFHDRIMRSKQNWFLLEHESARFALGPIQSGFREFAVCPNAQVSVDLQNQAEGFLYALSFYVGERVSWLGCDSASGGMRRIVLKQPARKISTLLQNPRQEEMDRAREAELLTCAFNFFVRPENLPVVNWLAMLWDTADCFHPVQCLVAATVLEGITQHISDDSLDQDAANHVKRSKRSARKLVEKNWPRISAALAPAIRRQFLNGI